MKKVFALLGLGLLITSVLAITIGGTAMASPRTGNGDQLQSRDCSCDNCVSDTCDPVNHDYNHNHNYLTPGPHMAQAN
jgi:hypothetical protein